MSKTITALAILAVEAVINFVESTAALLDKGLDKLYDAGDVLDQKHLKALKEDAEIANRMVDEARTVALGIIRHAEQKAKAASKAAADFEASLIPLID